MDEVGNFREDNMRALRSKLTEQQSSGSKGTAQGKDSGKDSKSGKRGTPSVKALPPLFSAKTVIDCLVGQIIFSTCRQSPRRPKTCDPKPEEAHRAGPSEAHHARPKAALGSGRRIRL